MQRFSLFFILTICFCSNALLTAQELNFTVKVVPPPSRNVDIKVYNALQQALQELVTTTKWTDDVFEPNERLVGTMQLTIKAENTVTDFVADLNIQFNRPVYGTDQLTPLLVHIDRDIAFRYEANQPMQYAQNAYSDNLVHTLAYFSYVALAYDYDSFAPNGGEAFWQKAQEIINVVPTDGQDSWRGKTVSSTARGAFTENALNPRLKSFRTALYDYHRNGIDFASTDMPRCRTGIIKALNGVDEAQISLPGTLILRAFTTTKGDEMIEIFKNAPTEQKTRFLQVMARLDPTNVGKYSSVGF